MNAKNRTIFLIAGVCAVVIAIALTLVLTLKQPHVHAYGDPTYAWSTENGEQYCTATKTCSSCKDGATGHEIFEKVAAKVMVTQSRTCTLPELADLKAEFTVEGFTSQTRSGEQTKPATGHAFSQALTATADEHYHACENAGCTATEGNAAHSPSQDYVTVAESTCSEKGRKAKVCADCGYEIDPIEIAIDETKHAYGDPIYVWSNDFGKCTGKIVCAHNAAHEITEEGFVVKPGDPRIKGKGQITYTAYFDPNSPFAEQTHTENYSAYKFVSDNPNDEFSIEGLIYVREKSVSFIILNDPYASKNRENEVKLIDAKNGIYSVTLSSYKGRNINERYLVTLDDSDMITVAFKPSSLGVAYEDYTFDANHPKHGYTLRVYTDNGHSYADLIAIDTADIPETYICKIDKENNVLVADGKYYTIDANNVLSVSPAGTKTYSCEVENSGSATNVVYEFHDNGYVYKKEQPAGKTEYAYVEAYKYTAPKEYVFVVDEGINRKAFSIYKINNVDVVKPMDIDVITGSPNTFEYQFSDYDYINDTTGVSETIFFTVSPDTNKYIASISISFHINNTYGINLGSFLVYEAYWELDETTNIITIYDDTTVNNEKKFDRSFQVVNGQVQEIHPAS